MGNSYPTWILERSFGGLGTAVSPENASKLANWPNGLSSPMAREACEALVSACNGAASVNDPRCLVFLVGGAGNGKSKLAADTVAAIEGNRLGEKAPFAQRTYDYSLETGGRLRVINDATIPPADRHGTPLARDLGEVFTSGDHLLACINRGVLIGEARGRDPGPEREKKDPSLAIIQWLLSGRLDAAGTPRWQFKLVEPDDLPSYYAVAEFWEDGALSAMIHVVYMDGASLLEHWIPPADTPKDYRSSLTTGSVEVVPVLSEDRATKQAAFHRCVTGAALAFKDQLSRHALDPVLANATSLSSDVIAAGWCSLLRGAAVISGTHFTYRELWALFSHSICGPANSENLSRLSGWVDDRVSEVQSGTREARLRSLLALGSLRTHMLLFDAGRSATIQNGLVEQFAWADTENDALRAARLADPLRHYGPAGGKENTELAQELSEIEEGHLPGEKLSSKCPAVKQYWSPLDAEIERAIQEEVDPRNETSNLKRRNWLLGWYGRYMYRLVGLSKGWCAHCSVVDEWQNAWIDAERSNRLSHDLSEAILDIVAPPSNERGAETYFTFMQARVDAGEGAVERAMIGLPRNRFEISARADGERVELRIEQGTRGDGPPAALAILDFHLLREAMSRRNGYGFTDSLMLIEPRIERIRASLVSHQLSQNEASHRFKFNHTGQPVVTR